MADKKWTEGQSKAINTRDRTLLVSAAAGSGKTATLTERIIASITDENDPVNIEDMLIVTYTRAAAGELSERIGRALKRAVRERPNDARLERQLHMLPSSKICTIDSFCVDILRANSERVGVNPGFRIPDAAEAQLLAEKLLSSLLEAIYEGELPGVATPEEIDALTDCLAQTKNQEALPSVIRMIYDSTLYALEGVDSIGILVDEYDPVRFTSVESTRFGAYCMKRLSDALSHYRPLFAEFDREITDRGSAEIKDVGAMVKDALELISLLDDAKTYNEVHEILTGYTFKRAASVKEKYALPPIGVVRASFKDDIIELADKFFSYSERDWRTAYEGLYRLFGVLYRVVKEFDRIFRQEKLNRGICEFTDIERYTYECLWQNGERTDVAIAQSKIYKALYIDEYQDVNSLQNKIFEAISTGDNRFMVGDIKQSIYEFRSANPRIFANMKMTYPPLGSEGDYPCASIFMSDNFRCDKGVIDFVNDIFDNLFDKLKDSIGYVPEDRLNFSKLYGHEIPEYRYPEVCLAYNFKKDDPRSLMASPSDTAAEIIARKIKELLDDGYLDNGEKIEPRHIAIIMRNVKSRSTKYSDELARFGIPSVYKENERFFINSDVLLVLSLLNSIDNPRKDIYLAGLMCSPLFSFSLGETALIKHYAPADTLYDSLIKYVAEGLDAEGRVEKFLGRIESYRLLSEGLPTDKLLLRLYRETGLLALVSQNGEGRDNLMLLYEHARKFESGSFKGLYNFISYINQLTGRESEFDKKEAPGECDAVRIITAHGSKGLEYPVVFFAEAEKSFSQSGKPIGEAPRFEYEEGFGMGMFLRTPSGLALVSNPTKDIIKDYRSRKKIEEEARVLYVVLTRARERLYIVGNAGTDPDGYLEKSAAAREFLSPYSVYSTPSFLRMILDSNKSSKIYSPEQFLLEPPYIYTCEAAQCADGDIEAKPNDLATRTVTEDDGSGIELSDHTPLAEELLRRFSFEYPDEHLTHLPGKLSVSKLYPAILDGSEDMTEDIFEDGNDEEIRTGYLPAFRSGTDADISAKKGIATHMLLQFCDLELLAERGARAELKRLTEAGFLSESDASLVRIREIDKFVSSRLIDAMRGASRIYREFRFNVKLPAEKFTTDPALREKLKGEYALVQGVIDCLYADERGEYHLVDYKTDRLTPEELSDKEKARERMSEKHSLQLSYYADAVELIFGKRPSTVEVYSLQLGDTLRV